MPFRIKDSEAPYRAQLEVGAGLPFTWDLYLQTPDGAGGWTRASLGTGTGSSSLALTALKAGSVLTWSVLTINNDAESQNARVSAQLTSAKGDVQTVSMSAQVSRKEPAFFMYVQLAEAT